MSRTQPAGGSLAKILKICWLLSVDVWSNLHVHQHIQASHIQSHCLQTPKPHLSSPFPWLDYLGGRFRQEFVCLMC